MRLTESILSGEDKEEPFDAAHCSANERGPDVQALDREISPLEGSREEDGDANPETVSRQAAGDRTLATAVNTSILGRAYQSCQDGVILRG